ncbi:hypothetical protein Q1695_014738 [Nippostrongylus brasiliensis]|nr:hypothetical protein Q1695_014738 [Nippostrongylus brasiliensis]
MCSTLCVSSKVSFTRALRFSKSIRLAMGDTPLDVHAWRAQYLNREEPVLIESNLATRDPFKLFDIWFKNVASQNVASFEELNAVCFSTVGKDLRPASRMVLLKSYNNDGFSFYTNYNSRKGRELEANPNACMLFYWPMVHRQVRVEGQVSKLDEQAAIEYWNSRPLPSRIGSKCSEQSTVVPDREFLINKREALEKQAENEGSQSITKPQSWGGYILTPDYFEFWQGQSDRLHDRLEFKKTGEEWTMQRLSP